MMLDIARTIVASLLITAAASPPPESRAFQKHTPSEALEAAARRGKELLTALHDYTYFAELTIQTISQSDTITGKYYRLSQISFDRAGNRQEKVIENTSTLPDDIYIGTKTANDLTRIYQFVITPETLIQYELNYVGRERIDELDTLVFDIQPKTKIRDFEKDGQRYLKGRLWIDEQDLCVVKAAGQALPPPNTTRTPTFETYFQNHGSYWFPAYASADESIRVGRYFTHVVVSMRFTGYKKAGAK
jgi:hypothetical protein